jgi:hypothetical protein
MKRERPNDDDDATVVEERGVKRRAVPMPGQEVITMDWFPKDNSLRYRLYRWPDTFGAKIINLLRILNYLIIEERG